MDPVTIASIFTAAGSTMTGFLTLVGDFFAGLWAIPMGQLIISMAIVSAAIGLCLKLFLRRRRV